MTKLQILQQVTESNWQPEFEFTDDIDRVVDSILKPHEDYFLGLHSKVKEIIENQIVFATNPSLLYWNNAPYKITFANLCNWQKELFEHKKDLIDIAVSKLYQQDLESHHTHFAIKAGCLPNQHINLGLRTTTVKVGDWTPPHPMFLEDLKEMCFSIDLEFTTKTTIDYGWYVNTCLNAIHIDDFIYDYHSIDNYKIDYEKYEKEVINHLTEWYKVFETIHFFNDLNGRVGGIVINIISYILTGKYLIDTNYAKEL